MLIKNMQGKSEWLGSGVAFFVELAHRRAGTL